MATKGVTVGFSAHGPRVAGTSIHATLVASLRAKLSGKKSPLGSIAPEELKRAREEFREIPEVAGEPLPESEGR
jgi:hypothetical protein